MDTILIKIEQLKNTPNSCSAKMSLISQRKYYIEDLCAQQFYHETSVFECNHQIYHQGFVLLTTATDSELYAIEAKILVAIVAICEKASAHNISLICSDAFTAELKELTKAVQTEREATFFALVRTKELNAGRSNKIMAMFSKYKNN